MSWTLTDGERCLPGGGRALGSCQPEKADVLGA